MKMSGEVTSVLEFGIADCSYATHFSVNIFQKEYGIHLQYWVWNGKIEGWVILEVHLIIVYLCKSPHIVKRYLLLSKNANCKGIRAIWKFGNYMLYCIFNNTIHLTSSTFINMICNITHITWKRQHHSCRVHKNKIQNPNFFKCKFIDFSDF